jgi:hypothetical protein
VLKAKLLQWMHRHPDRWRLSLNPASPTHGVVAAFHAHWMNLLPPGFNPSPGTHPSACLHFNASTNPDGRVE